MNRLIAPGDWVPQGITVLEPAAKEAILVSDQSFSVTAGPGAGKTELLAQRAAFLLQTGVCEYPQRVLAICFKKDAAKNIKDRVSLRCSPLQAKRFDSRTFDAFAKAIVDRFHGAIPERWRPTKDYAIDLLGKRDWRNYLAAAPNPPGVLDARKLVAEYSPDEFRDLVTSQSLSRIPQTATSLEEWAIDTWWQDQLGARPSRLTFPMIGRLAELTLLTNPQMASALRLTYSFVFMDEFQDATAIQYDLAKAAFLDSDAIITAVGDNKQQIMKWAGAVDDIFERYERDFRAKRCDLRFNFRSSPELVEIQYALATAIDNTSAKAVSQRDSQSRTDHCAVLEFTSEREEAEYLADFIQKGMGDGLDPRDFVILVRGRADNLEATLAPSFIQKGLGLRNEARKIQDIAIQDLLTEPLTELVVQFLGLATLVPAAPAWHQCLESLASLRTIPEEHQEKYRRLQEDLGDLKRVVAKHMTASPKNCELKSAIVSICKYIGEPVLQGLAPQYRQGDWMMKVLRGTYSFFQECASNSDTWPEAFDAYRGADQIPLMTIHKSKGLEFHTMLFVGLDDKAYWNMDTDQRDGLTTFFVAFSRARDRAFFTYCPNRANREKVAILYELLDSAGVPIRDMSK